MGSFGGLDVLVNNSGVYEFAPIEAITEESFHRQFNINVLGLLLVTKHAVPHIKSGASIINLSSVVSTLTPAMASIYSATKGAVAITGSLSRELRAPKSRGSSRLALRLLHPRIVRNTSCSTRSTGRGP